jgi:hypothetical protein
MLEGREEAVVEISRARRYIPSCSEEDRIENDELDGTYRRARECVEPS